MKITLVKEDTLKAHISLFCAFSVIKES
jgi:hypothetical protein